MMCLREIYVLNTDTRTIFVGYVSVKCTIQKIFVRFLTILVLLKQNFKREKYINFLKFKFVV